MPRTPLPVLQRMDTSGTRCGVPSTFASSPVSFLFVPMLVLFCWGVGRHELNPVLRYAVCIAASLLLAGISAFFTILDGALMPELAAAAILGAPVLGCLVAWSSGLRGREPALPVDEGRPAERAHRDGAAG